MSSVITRAKTVATSDGQIAIAKNRSYIGIQNLNASNDVHIGLGSEPVTALSGVRVGPGEFFELRAKNNSSEIRGISITGNVNIVFLEAN